MEIVFIDSEPPDASGGGIRTYLRMAMGICRAAGHPAKVYTHTPSAYPGETAHAIGRKPWLRRPLRGLAYRLFPAENVLWEHARWLEAELSAQDAPERVYEFCDFMGYAYFTLRNRTLLGRVLVRVHTPGFLVTPPTGKGAAPFWKRFAARLQARRERDCLVRAARITVPSAAFIHEKLPWLTRWEHVPNPLPPDMREAGAASRDEAAAKVTGKPPVTPAIPTGGGSGWAAAQEDPAELRLVFNPPDGPFPMAPQSVPRRPLAAWIARAVTSLPVPVSPRTRTERSVGAIVLSSRASLCMR